MKIYTRGGDQGETGMLGGHRVSKNHPAIAVCGDLDETNAAIGMAIAQGVSPETNRSLEQIQKDLFVIGAHVAASQGTARSMPRLADARIVELEQSIDNIETLLEPMTAFILPGGGPTGSMLHVARTVCRRAERSLIQLQSTLSENETLEQDLVYLNRLSDLLFVMARNENRLAEKPETKWLPGS